MSFCISPLGTSILGTLSSGASMPQSRVCSAESSASTLAVRRHADFDIAHASPIEPFDQSRELRGREAHDAVLNLRPAKRAFLQPLGEQRQARTIPDDQPTWWTTSAT